MVLRVLEQTDRVECAERRRAAFFFTDARIEHRQLDVFDRARPRQQVVGLEDEAHLAAADVGERIFRQFGDIAPIEGVVARGRPVEKPYDVHEGRFARTRRSHDGDELAGIDREIDPSQRDHRLFDERVDAAQLADFDNAGH